MDAHSPRTRLVMFAKYWQPGEVKTRLGSAIGLRVAAELHRQFVLLLSERLCGQADECVVYASPPARAADFRATLDASWQVGRQSSGNLGERLLSCFQESFDQGFDRVAIVGSDSPTLPTARIRDAFRSLDAHHLALGPALDGGYYLIAAKPPLVDVFQNIPWSTDRVWTATMDRLAAAGLRDGSGFAILDEWYDVDSVADLRRLSDDLTDWDTESAAARSLAAEVSEILHEANS